MTNLSVANVLVTRRNWSKSTWAETPSSGAYAWAGYGADDDTGLLDSSVLQARALKTSKVGRDQEFVPGVGLGVVSCPASRIYFPVTDVTTRSSWMRKYLEDYQHDIRKHKSIGVFDNATAYKRKDFSKGKGCGRYDRSAAPKQRSSRSVDRFDRHRRSQDRRSHRRSRSQSTSLSRSPLRFRSSTGPQEYEGKVRPPREGTLSCVSPRSVRCAWWRVHRDSFTNVKSAVSPSMPLLRVGFELPRRAADNSTGS